MEQKEKKLFGENEAKDEKIRILGRILMNDAAEMAILRLSVKLLLNGCSKKEVEQLLEEEIPLEFSTVELKVLKELGRL